jgi:hypothetical protein
MKGSRQQARARMSARWPPLWQRWLLQRHPLATTQGILPSRIINTSCSLALLYSTPMPCKLKASPLVAAGMAASAMIELSLPAFRIHSSVQGDRSDAQGPSDAVWASDYACSVRDKAIRIYE